jgi:hypothetical protein
MTELAGYIGVPEPLIKAALADLSQWHVLGERMLAESRRECPVGHNTELGATYGKEHGGEHLRDSLEVRYEYGVDPRIMVGSKMTRGDSNVSALGLIEEGTDAHSIDPKPGGVLRFTSGGQVVFAKHVEHPGTKKNAFVERAMRTVILEATV